MKQNELEMLDKINQNVNMGLHAIEKLMPKIEDNEFKKRVEEQYQDYKNIRRQALNMIASSGNRPVKSNKMAQIMSTVGIFANTALDKTTSHLAEMMIEGSTMGITQITRELNHSGENVGSDIRGLADSLLHIEQKNIDDLRKYL